ncbi:hypothetical protein C8Q80DRAFT_1341248 [Daedaleopsis nitida]|nr:hypothetical protein C8Q80DRAFT_1341248 [Daedaleopsis nitida]
MLTLILSRCETTHNPIPLSYAPQRLLSDSLPSLLQMIDPLQVLYLGLLLPRPILLLLFLLTSHVRADSVNRTIDNKGEGITYTPPTLWKEGSTCLACGAQLHPASMFQGTWEDTTQAIGEPPRFVTITFNGTAVYVYNAIVNYLHYDLSQIPVTDLSFVLDQAPAGNYTHVGTCTSPVYEYNVPVFSQEGLDDTEHVLEIHTVATASDSLVLFDYVIYTTTGSDQASTPLPPPDDHNASITDSTFQFTQVSPPPTSIPTSGDSLDSRYAIPVPVGLIVGCTIGGITLGLLIAVLISWLLRRRHSHAPDTASPDLSELIEKEIIDPRTRVAESRTRWAGFENTIPAEETTDIDYAVIVPVEEAPVIPSLSTRARWEDTRTEYTASDGTMTRVETDIAVLRDELTRLRQDHVLQRASWDQEPPQYQERVVD